MNEVPILVPPQGLMLDLDVYKRILSGCVTRAVLLGTWAYLPESTMVINFLGTAVGLRVTLDTVAYRQLGNVTDAESVAAGWLDNENLTFAMRMPFSINGNVNRKTQVTLLSFTYN